MHTCSSKNVLFCKTYKSLIPDIYHDFESLTLKKFIYIYHEVIKSVLTKLFIHKNTHSFLGVFPLTSTSLMTPEQKEEFLPIVRTFTGILEKGSANAKEANALLTEANKLTTLLPANVRNSISGLTSGFRSGQLGSGNKAGMLILNTISS